MTPASQRAASTKDHFGLLTLKQEGFSFLPHTFHGFAGQALEALQAEEINLSNYSEELSHTPCSGNAGGQDHELSKFSYDSSEIPESPLLLKNPGQMLAAIFVPDEGASTGVRLAKLTGS